MQHRLDVLAAAAPFHPVQVMVGNPSQPQPRLRTGDVTAAGSTGPPDPPPKGGGNEAPSGSGNGN
eukprot:2953624-Heterocapsa_arctica.AAC.1